MSWSWLEVFKGVSVNDVLQCLKLILSHQFIADVIDLMGFQDFFAAQIKMGLTCGEDGFIWWLNCCHVREFVRI